MKFFEGLGAFCILDAFWRLLMLASLPTGSRLVCSVMHGLVHVQRIRVTAEAICRLWQLSLNNK